jgi:hypothetical protein
MIKPKQGQKIKCFLRANAMVLEGIVEEWSDVQVVLRSLNDSNLMIIHRPVEDILMTKIECQDQIDAKIPEVPIIKQEIRETLHQVLAHPQEVDLNKANLKRLRELVIEQEQKIIKDKKQEHFGTVGNAKMAVGYTEQIDLLTKKTGG